MKYPNLKLIIALSFLVPSFLPLNSQAAPPRSHRCTIVVESVDTAHHTVRIRGMAAHSVPQILRWDEKTRLISSTGLADPAGLKPGQRISIFHRKPLMGRWWSGRIASKL
jgi:hypothetical protein